MSRIALVCVPLALSLPTNRLSDAERDLGVLDVDPTNWLRECVEPYKTIGFPSMSTRYLSEWSNYYQLAMPSGLCADALSCAFERCAWTQNASQALQSIDDLSAATFSDVAPSLPPLNLPLKIAFPESVTQLAQIVEYANSAGLPLSVLTSGHSYPGSHTWKGSVQANLRNFPKYSQKSIALCDDPKSAGPSACKLALARGKTAVTRVGGGELWDDVYRAFLDWNTKTGRFIDRGYQAVGGGAGTVGASGGWLSGGGLSTGLERMYGFGVDQVLELEMVLPDGVHVKFGPTAWVSTDGFQYPQTTKVEGKCNANIVTDEQAWVWTDCKTDIPFNDLWFAVRGGGGGTYGFITASHIQLHDLWDLQFVFIRPAELVGAQLIMKSFNESTQNVFDGLWFDFFTDFLWDPSNLNVSVEDSNGCGSAGFTLSLTGTITGGSFTGLWCKKEAAQVLISAWGDYAARTLPKRLPILAGWQSAIVQRLLSVVADWKTYPEQMMKDNAASPRSPLGHVPDNPPVTLQSCVANSWSAAIPTKWLLQKNEAVHTFFKYYLQGAHLVGGHAADAHDGTTAVSVSVRQAGLQSSIFDFPYPGMVGMADWRTSMRPFQGTEDGTYPPDTEFNHISPDIVGPLKANWSVSCPNNITMADQASLCVSAQESVWGAKVLSRLEQIKNKVDPTHLLNCYPCVGFQG